MEDHKARIDRQWDAAIPRGWGNPKSGWRSDRQERGDRDTHTGERGMLYDILDSDENIEALVGGTYRAEGSTGISRGVGVATDRRVVFVDKGVFGSTEVSEISYKRIEGITHSTGMMFGGVQILGIGRVGWRIDTVKPKESAKLFADAVRGLVKAHEVTQVSIEGQQANTSTAADELGEWGKHLKDGIVTQDEFDIKKRQLLGI